MEAAFDYVNTLVTPVKMKSKANYSPDNEPR